MVQLTISENDVVVGGAFFFKTPIETRLDFSCVPKELLTYADCEAIGKDLAENKTSGVVREYTWKVVGSHNENL
jgi:hypothetical protein